MKKIYTYPSAFTLIEIIVSMTIFGIMMISVISIFIFASQMSTLVELNRTMQENTKNVVEDIAENVRKYWIVGVKDGILGSCTLPAAMTSIRNWNKLCIYNWAGTGEWASYVIGKQNAAGDWERSSNITSDCWIAVEKWCHILKRDTPSWDYYPLTNSFISFEDIEFTITNTKIPKVTIKLVARPSHRQWLSLDIIQNNYTYIQTTLSERFIDMN